RCQQAQLPRLGVESPKCTEFGRAPVGGRLAVCTELRICRRAASRLGTKDGLCIEFGNPSGRAWSYALHRSLASPDAVASSPPNERDRRLGSTSPRVRSEMELCLRGLRQTQPTKRLRCAKHSRSCCPPRLLC